MNNVFRQAIGMLGFLGAASFAQAPTPTSGSAEQRAPEFSSEALDKVVAPVALYPDALISHVMPASTTLIDVVEAARYLRQHGGKIDKTPDKDWNVSVKVLMKFPDVLYKMDADIEWTKTLGQAVSAQLNDVMKAIQRVRHLAQAAGNLKSNDKQTVVVESDVIRIVPSSSVIYVPTYEPTQVVVVQEKSNDAAVAAVSFAVGVAVGAALADDDCDWYGYGIYHGPYYHGDLDWNDHWRKAAQLPWNPRGVADPRGRFDPRGRYDPRGAGGVGRAGVGGQAGLGGGAAGQAGVGGGAAGAGRAGAGGQAGVGGGAAGQAGAGGGAAGAGRAGTGGQAGAGGGAAGQAGAGRGKAGSSGTGGSRSAFAGQQGGASRTSAASSRGNKSLSGRGGRR